jgi:hypothetical protein
VPGENGSIVSVSGLGEVGEGCPVCRSVCTPLDEGTLQGAIERPTRALVTVDDRTIAGLALERAALREELRVMREGGASALALRDQPPVRQKRP